MSKAEAVSEVSREARGVYQEKGSPQDALRADRWPSAVWGTYKGAALSDSWGREMEERHPARGRPRPAKVEWEGLREGCTRRCRRGLGFC